MKDGQTHVNEHGGKQSFVSADFTCIPPIVLRLLAQCLGFGARKYGKDNWHNIPIEDNINHAFNHLNEWRLGDRSEPHLVNAMARITFALYLAVRDGLQDATYAHPEMVATPEQPVNAVATKLIPVHAKYRIGDLAIIKKTGDLITINEISMDGDGLLYGYKDGEWHKWTDENSIELAAIVDPGAEPKYRAGDKVVIADGVGHGFDVGQTVTVQFVGEDYLNCVGLWKDNPGLLQTLELDQVEPCKNS